MNPTECQALINAYLEWLRRGLSVEAVNGACELTTPFLDRHNDHLQIYAVRKNGTILLTDDGYTMSDLHASGLEVNSPKRRATVDSILRGFGVKMAAGDHITTEASDSTLGQRVHSLVQAMLAVNDMFVLAQPRIASFFWEDVGRFLDEHGVRYSPRVKISGKSGYDHGIDFLIPRSPSRPERLVQALNSPAKSRISAYLFSITDVRDVRDASVEAYAFLNDRDRPVGGDVMEALDAYDVKPAPWSHREEFVEALAG